MGMYDEFFLVGPVDEERAPRCAAGHLLRDLQTKDLDSTLAAYYLFDNVVYLDDRRSETRPLATHRFVAPAPGDGALPACLQRTSYTTYARAPRIGEIDVHTHCRTCLPIIIPANSRFHTELYPWCEFTFVFDDDGRWLHTRNGVRETRDQLRRGAKGPNVASEALADDHPDAVAIFAQRQQADADRYQWLENV